MLKRIKLDVSCKNNFIEILKNLIKYTVLKIILLAYQINYRRMPKHNKQCYKKFCSILAISLSVLYKLLIVPTKLFSDLYLFS